MSKITKNLLQGISVCTLKKLISDIPDDCTIDVWDIGDTGFVDGCELEIVTYEHPYDHLGTDISINIKAESGFH